MATCAQCGNALPEGARFCGQCGAVTASLAPPPRAAPQGTVPVAQGPTSPTAGHIPAAPVSIPATSSTASSPLNQTLLTHGSAGSSLSAKKTMMGVSAGDVASHAAAAPPPAPGPPHPPSGTSGRAGLKTMMGVAMPGIAPLREEAIPVSPTRPPERSSQESPLARSRTMLGVAMPGIAPLRDASEAPPAPSRVPDAAPGLPSGGPPRFGGTMLGVAVPGVAPLNPGISFAPDTLPPNAGTPSAGPPGFAPSAGASSMAPGMMTVPSMPPHVSGKLAHTVVPPPVVAMPPPLVDDDPVPEPPRRRTKRGVPLGVVAAIVGGLVLVGGATIALLYRGTKPMTAQPQVDAQGKEELLLRCVDCKDGTVADLDGAKAVFAAGEARLALAKPLDVGENVLAVSIDRPGVGRDETVRLRVPVAFRVRADLADIGARPPVITVRVGATPGSDVTVDGRPLALDTTGRGAYALDVSADTEGPADDLRVIDRKIPYAVTSKGAPPETGVVAARVAVAPLHLDSPGSHAVIDGPTFMVAGRTQPGGSVTLNDQPTPTAADGSFAQVLEAKAPGDLDVAIRASAPSRAPRVVHVVVKRVASLEAEARALDASPQLGYDALAADIASRVGQRIVVAGEVIEARASGHQVVALIDDRRGCARGPCLARVIASEDARLTHGATVRAYGRVTRAVAASDGKTVPEVEADFIVKGRGPR